jgi:redox-sensitive bicupin YhaK (pirin superfamily)
MITIRKSQERGHFDHGWLDTRHTFSFADYRDPRHMGFGPLRVINEDVVQPGEGFPRHFHRDMEIVTYLLDGALEHRDSMGNGSVIRPGDVQRMSAGTGVMHSEYNASSDERVHFLQIWFLPRRAGGAPSYEQTHFSDGERRGRLRLVASPDGADGSVTLQQDARLYATLLDGGQRVSAPIAAGRQGWVHVARGAVEVNGVPLGAGDGAALTDEKEVAIAATKESEVLLFDLV